MTGGKDEARELAAGRGVLSPAEREDIAIRDAADRQRRAEALDKQHLRALVRECVTVVAPGEVLVIRAGGMTPDQIAEWQDHLGREVEDFAPWIRLLIVPGDAAQALSLGELEAAADAAVERALSRQRHARGAGGSGAGGASSSGNGGVYVGTPGTNAGAGGGGAGSTDWAGARFTVTGGGQQ